ncbi:serine/threonine-protein kinase [Lapillicoccus jejuensis]|uniref:serine/threonine-protein kinase n=1 Tax=Lapillicoccus jejuensis TaxID=402171 RepID=UPI0014769013|nr:serine/threonine-protein kinase [Lapillicoccus jejuensis]
MDPTTPRPRRDVGEGDVLGGRYRVGRLLGRGGTATVHAATDEVLRREVAVKVLAAGLGTGAAREDEALLLASVSHPHLVTLHDADLTGEPSYLVMELVPGPSLAAQLRDGGPLTPDQVRGLATQLGSALSHIHDRGMVHRDLKPANVLLAAPLEPGTAPDARLTDFGIARIVDAARLTATGTVLGTAAYLSPEQARGGAVGPPSDVYSLGLVLLEAASGEVAYPGPALESAAARLARPPAVPAGLPQPLRALLTAMTSSDPVRRPTSQQVARLDPGARTAPLPALIDPGKPVDLNEPGVPVTRTLDPQTRTLDATTPAARPAPAGRPVRPRRRAGLLLALVGLVLAVVLGATLLTRPGPTAPASVPPTTTRTTPATPATTATTSAPSTTAAPAATTTVGGGTGTGQGSGPGNGGPGNGGPGNDNGGGNNGGGKGGRHGGKGKG